jgi:hypothetical protein
MELTRMVFLNSTSSTVIVAIVLMLFAVTVGFFMLAYSQTLPLAPAIKENFGGVAVGAGEPDCVRSSSEAAALYDWFTSHPSTAEEGADDLREFRLILSKLSCFKKDLLSISGIVEATRYQKYSTAHDLEPVAETTARCLAKTIPKRDLDLAFDKWASRGETLLKRLCTAYNATPGEIGELEKTFAALIKDVQDVANGACLQGEPVIAGGKVGARESGYEPPLLEKLAQYLGYY